jgi:hypothetical protein
MILAVSLMDAANTLIFKNQATLEREPTEYQVKHEKRKRKGSKAKVKASSVSIQAYTDFFRRGQIYTNFQSLLAAAFFEPTNGTFFSPSG